MEPLCGRAARELFHDMMESGLDRRAQADCQESRLSVGQTVSGADCQEGRLSGRQTVRRATP